MRKTLVALLIILCSAGAIRAQIQVTIESSSSSTLSPEGRRALAYKHSQAGKDLRMRGKNKEALEEFEKALKLVPDHYDACANMVYAYRDLERYDEALELQKKVVSLRPNISFAHNTLGELYLAVKRYDAALEAFQKALGLFKTEKHYHNVGRAYYALGKYEEAAEAIKAAVTQDESYAEGFYDLGLIYMDKLGRYEEAAEAFKGAIRQEPEYVWARYWLGIMYLRLGNRDAAVGEYKAIKKIGGDAAKKAAEELDQEIRKAKSAP